MANPQITVTVKASTDANLAADMGTILSGGNEILYVVPLTTLVGGVTPILIAYVPAGT